MIRVAYLPANQAYCVQYGEQLIPINDRFLYSTREELLKELDRLGLEVIAKSEVIKKRSQGDDHERL